MFGILLPLRRKARVPTVGHACSFTFSVWCLSIVCNPQELAVDGYLEFKEGVTGVESDFKLDVSGKQASSRPVI